jgi:uncharacterized protein YdhG (YjbR/CyaY superfamily)
MAKTIIDSIDGYIAAQPKAAQPVLQRVRGAIRKALPKAEEVISYKIPAFKLNGRIVIFFAGWSGYYSIYPVNDRLMESFEGALDPYRSGEGTLRFSLADPVPVKLIERIAKFRAADL